VIELKQFMLMKLKLWTQPNQMMNSPKGEAQHKYDLPKSPWETTKLASPNHSTKPSQQIEMETQSTKASPPNKD
jgi:hypothetical protein